MENLRWIVAVLFLVPSLGYGETDLTKVPDEYESIGGHALGLGNAGMAALGGPSAVRANPAMIALEKNYTLSAGYHWPSAGREFYQAGIVDSVTSDIAAGVSYVGYEDDFVNLEREDQIGDSRVDRRASVALAKILNKLSFGLSAHFISGYEYHSDEREKLEKKSGATAGIGVAGLLTQTLRVGASVENLGNRKVKEFAPQIVRAGVAFMTFGGNLTLHLDYRQRENLTGEPLVDERSNDEPTVTSEPITGPERMMFASTSLKVYDLIRILGSYGWSVSGSDRTSAGYGIGLVHEVFSISYNIFQPYLKSSKTHNAVNVNVVLAM
ncbi:MAG: hypothetical protein AB7T49_02450 [Oligoflexales bacterium]